VRRALPGTLAYSASKRSCKRFKRSSGLCDLIII
jgi:hypothetical protein